MRGYLSGLGAVGWFGDSLQALEKGLAKGGPTSDALLEPSDLSGLARFVERRALRRVDHYCRLALYSAHLALEDAGLSPEEISEMGERTALVIATGQGATGSTFRFLDSIIEDGDSSGSPTHFSNSVHNAAAAHVSMRLGIKGPNLTVSQGGGSLASALAGALGYLSGGQAEAVLFGWVDERCAVYDFGGAHTAGEGAAFFWLTPEPVSGSYCKLTLEAEPVEEAASSLAGGLELALSALDARGGERSTLRGAGLRVEVEPL